MFRSIKIPNFMSIFTSVYMRKVGINIIQKCDFCHIGPHLACYFP